MRFLKKLLILFLCCVILFGSLQPSVVLADDKYEDETVTGVCSEPEPAAFSKKPAIDAAAAIVMDSKSGRVLYEKNSRVKKAIASTTKIMTCIIALERGNPDDIVTVSKRAASVWGSTIKLKQGQKLKLEELLYGLMLNSGNDAAIAIAEHIGGTVESFAVMMNEKAREIGAFDSSFKTPHGLDVQGHYSTAYDMALITRYALTNPQFSKIVGTKSAQISCKGLYNTNEMLGVYPGADGVKTGYTGQAGRCLVTSATRGGMRLISVVLGSPTRTKRAQASKSILDYSFLNYKPYTVLEAGEVIKSIPAEKGVLKEVEIKAVEEFVLPMTESEISSLEREVTLPAKMEAPLREGQEAGTIKLLLNGEVLLQSKLVAAKSVERKGLVDYFGELLLKWQRIMRQGI
ncbi:MAG: D-alanyl-D-alanine carboxypeptidase [Clostridia bacterium]|nr:D-alanyl-D-alanine carboxypeptidase [Clostridia bacterium]